MDPDPIAAVEAKTALLPLPRTLRLGPMVIRERAYAVVRVRTQSGLVGYAYSQTRGAPVAAVIEEMLAPVLVGADSAELEARWRDCFRATMAAGRVGLVIRAISLIEIALWDVRAQRAGVPLYRALGGERDEVEVMFVAGYPATTKDVAGVVAAAGAAAEDGHRLIKVARSSDPAVTRELLRGLEDALPAGTRVVVDCNWVWTDASEALDEVRTWPIDRIAWVEDLFPPEEIAAYASMRESGVAPIGVGDDLTDPSVARALVAAGVDVLRLDVTAIGGLDRAASVARHAAAAGVPVSFHIYPEISVHCAASWPAGVTIETFDRSSNPYDPSHLLIEGGPVFKGGRAHLPSTPGIGFTIDPGRFER